MNRKFTDLNESFVCTHCGTQVPPSGKSCRNHCPECLHSVHVDVNPGDRSANCGGLMIPVDIFVHPKKGYQVTHVCRDCGYEGRNILALDDMNYPDSMDCVTRIMECRVKHGD